MKRTKHEPTGHIAKGMMRLNLHIGPVITQMTNTQNMNNYEMSTQKTRNLHVCSTKESK